MLNQEINLYRNFEQTPVSGNILSWKQFCIINYIILGFFLIGYLNALWGSHRTTSKRDALTNQYTLLVQKVDTLKSKYPKDFFNQDTAKSIDQLKSELEKQEQLLRSLVNITPFSQQFAALSRVIIPNVWLTNISIIKGGQEISMKGKTIGIQNLQIFIKNIFADKNFSDYSLHINNINDANYKKQTNTFNFELKFVKNTG